MGGCSILRHIFSISPIGFPRWFFALRSALLNISKRPFSSHKQVDNQSARKFSKLPGASFCRNLSKSWRWYDPFSTVHQQQPRAPPRKSEPMSYHIQIFGGQVMNKASCHDIQIKIFATTTLAVVVTLYHRPQSTMERGVSI